MKKLLIVIIILISSWLNLVAMEPKEKPKKTLTQFSESSDWLPEPAMKIILPRISIVDLVRLSKTSNAIRALVADELDLRKQATLLEQRAEFLKYVQGACLSFESQNLPYIIPGIFLNGFDSIRMLFLNDNNLYNLQSGVFQGFHSLEI